MLSKFFNEVYYFMTLYFFVILKFDFNEFITVHNTINMVDLLL